MASRLIDLTGKRFGRLTVKYLYGTKSTGCKETSWYCECDCGGNIITSYDRLKSGKTKSCGCLNIESLKSRYKDLTGKRFGKLLVVEKMDSVNGKIRWRCKCDCGNEKITYGIYLTTKRVQSCGCLHDENLYNLIEKRKKGNIKLRNTFYTMKQRCYNKNNQKYYCYGARGIYICDEWLNDIESFIHWSLSHGYSDELSIDRIDNDGPYSPDNCRWTTNKKQANNKRTNRVININGESHTISEWSKITNINAGTISSRINRAGWSEYDAITIPPNKIRNYNQQIRNQK